MLQLIALIFAVTTLALAQEAGSNSARFRVADAQAIPTAALPFESNVYRYTDPTGKAWLYVRTPFGVSRYEDKPAPRVITAALPSVTVTELGDDVRFEFQTPFGISRWVSKKAELTDGEQIMLLRQQLKNQCAVETTASPAIKETK